MNKKTFDIQGPLLFSTLYRNNARRTIVETFREDWFEDSLCGNVPNFVQENQSMSKSKGTMRGMHFQCPPHAQGKLIKCLSGAILDVSVDIRKSSPTFGQHVSAKLTPENGFVLWVPEGFLHGFLTLADNTIVQYKCTDYYTADCEISVVWNDPDLNIDWGISNDDVIISDRDSEGIAMANFSSPF